VKKLSIQVYFHQCSRRFQICLKYFIPIFFKRARSATQQQIYIDIILPYYDILQKARFPCHHHVNTKAVLCARKQSTTPLRTKNSIQFAASPCVHCDPFHKASCTWVASCTGVASCFSRHHVPAFTGPVCLKETPKSDASFLPTPLLKVLSNGHKDNHQRTTAIRVKGVSH
jgi:hypothetical protein